MRDYIDLGPSPADEPCQQAGPNYKPEQASKEMRALIAQIRRIIGPEPEGARLAVKSFITGGGGYREVVCYFDNQNQAAIDYAFKAEAEYPEKWDEQARKDLGL